VPHAREICALTLDREEDDAKALAANEANLPFLRQNALDELIASEENSVTEIDRPTLDTCLQITQTEFALLETLVRVYDHARSHFIFEICDPPVKRFLNAIRIRLEEDGDRMPFSLYPFDFIDGCIPSIKPSCWTGCKTAPL
jgi:hypothetical protein